MTTKRKTAGKKAASRSRYKRGWPSESHKHTYYLGNDLIREIQAFAVKAHQGNQSDAAKDIVIAGLRAKGIKVPATALRPLNQ